MVFLLWEGINRGEHYEYAGKDFRYEQLFDSLEQNNHAALFWEQYGFETIFPILKQLKIPFRINPGDIRPYVRTVDGKEVEVDFRIEIDSTPVYFGVTAFYSRPEDLLKDLEDINAPLHDLKQDTFYDGHLISSEEIGSATLVKKRPQTEYLNRRMAVRIAREGKHMFPHDYIYIFFPQADPGFGGGIDGIPASFKFESNYTFKQSGIRGIMLIGQYVEVHSRGMMVRKDKWCMRTKPLGCSSQLEYLLKRLDGVTLDLKPRLNSMKAILEARKDDPRFGVLLKDFLAEYGDVI
jgi:hypothetical protein